MKYIESLEPRRFLSTTTAPTDNQIVPLIPSIRVIDAGPLDISDQVSVKNSAGITVDPAPTNLTAKIDGTAPPGVSVSVVNVPAKGNAAAYTKFVVHVADWKLIPAGTTVYVDVTGPGELPVVVPVTLRD